ncbi:hypothetical protein IP84_10115 [beta proteobacterium AAP99]|nr:hypothetical protein IP84_10115 [beta proteobacterium AAP99]
MQGAAGWISQWDRQIIEESRATLKPTRYAVRSTGHVLPFYWDGAAWTNYSVTRDRLTEVKDASGVRTGWTYQVFEDDSVETYDASGVLRSVRGRNGWVTTLSYSTAGTPSNIAPRPGLLISVRNQFGRELRFTYDASARLKELLPPGAVSGSAAGSAASPIVYRYGELASLGVGVAAGQQLTSATWQDGSVKRYHYEDSRFPNHVTGITDEAGTRISTVRYLADGRVASSEGVNGTDRLEFSFSPNFNQTTITDYSGSNGSATQRVYSFGSIGAASRPTSVTAPCPLCGSTAASTVWGDGTAATGGANARRQKFKEVAHDGTVTFYIYDTRGRETERATFPARFAGSTTRPALASASRVVSTQWHGTFNLPTRIAEPNKLTAYTYASNGNLTGQSVTATTDATGAAKFSAARDMSQPIPSTGWSYNTQQLPTTVVERETPAGATVAGEKGRWTYIYDSVGNIKSATDATRNLVGTASQFNSDGRLVSGTNESGGSVSFSYNARGFVTSMARGTQSAGFALDPTGRTTEIRSPSGKKLALIYAPHGTIKEVRVDGVVVTAERLRSGDFDASWFEQLEPFVVTAINILLPSANAQIPLPTPRPLPPPVPGIGPGQPSPDESALLNELPGFDKNVHGDARNWWQDICSCKVNGGYPKPTFTSTGTFVHLFFGGHLFEVFADKSYFTIPANQSLVDEVASRGIGRPSGDRDRYANVEMGRIVGMCYSRLKKAFEPSSRITMVVQRNNCTRKTWSGNEVVTMYPDCP